MPLRKKIRYGLLLLVVLGVAYGIYYAFQYAHIGSGYAAKTVCSCMFVSGRDSASVRGEDLYSVSFATTKIDFINQTVTANIYGLGEATAVFRKGLGCTLLNDIPEAELRQQPSVPPADTLTEQLVLHTPPQEIDEKLLQKTIDEAFAEKDTNHMVRTRAVVVLYKGQLIAERYAEGITPQMPLIGWSMTKSITNAMIGMLVKDGKLALKKPAPIAEWQQDDRRNITIDHLMRMSSGLDFEEYYGGISDATRMLMTAHGAGKYAICSKQRIEPDKEWYYSSGTTNILQEIIRQQFASLKTYLTFPHQRLFQKIGMKSAVIEPDASGTYVGSSYMFASARDWAKFGQLYLQDGVWNGERLLPEGWVAYSSTETPHANGQYAAQFWIDHQDKSFPQDAFMALGFEGQSVTIVPSKQLVIVRLGCTSNENDFNRSLFIKQIVKTVR